MRRFRKAAWVGLLVLILVLALVGRPGWHLYRTWRTERAFVTTAMAAGQVDDASHLTATAMEVITAPDDPIAAEAVLRTVLTRAEREGRKVTIAGARHSMGGHTLYPGGISIDLRAFRRLSLDPARRVLRAGAGAHWAEIIPFLDRQGLAVAVMQSNDDFSIGGSLSVNCHGWQHDTTPIAGTVESLRVMRADGVIVRCSRGENSELFRLVLGGYGLFGIILEADLQVVPNEFYHPVRRIFPLRDYVQVYREMTRADAGMAYGRISVAPDSFLREAAITVFERTAAGRPVAGTLTGVEPSPLKRLVFRGTVGSDYGKNLRWQLEKRWGESRGTAISRSQLQYEPSAWFENHDPAATEILHEYFVPVRSLVTFVEQIAPILQASQADLLNITVRNVRRDDDTFLAYATEEMFGLVMLFHQARDAAGDAAMAQLTQKLIAAALASGGRYYLPYRLHATRDQFAQAYPQGGEFFALKRKYDPGLIFQNGFYQAYGLAR